MILSRSFPGVLCLSLPVALLAHASRTNSPRAELAHPPAAMAEPSSPPIEALPPAIAAVFAAAGPVDSPAAIAAVLQIFGGGCIPVYPTDGFVLTPTQWNSIPIAGETNCGTGTDCEAAWLVVESWSDDYSTRDTTPDLANINLDEDVVCWANAVRWRGTGTSTYRDRVWDMLQDAMTYTPGSTTANGPGRNMLSYVLAADAIDLRSWDVDGLGTYDENADFKTWIDGVHDHMWGNFDGCNGLTLRGCAKDRPQNIGFMCGASVIAIEMYLQHDSHICDMFQYFKGVCGDRTAYSGFTYNSDLSWHPSSGATPRPINPVGATANSNDVDGAIPDDMRRVDGCGTCTAPTINCYGLKTNYVWEALEGIVMSAHLLDRMGSASFGWQNSAVKRTHDFLYNTYGFPPEEACSSGAGCDACDGSHPPDNQWVPHIVQAHYGTSYTLQYGVPPGKCNGFADWWAAGIP